MPQTANVEAQNFGVVWNQAAGRRGRPFNMRNYGMYVSVAVSRRRRFTERGTDTFDPVQCIALVPGRFKPYQTFASTLGIFMPLAGLGARVGVRACRTLRSSD